MSLSEFASGAVFAIALTGSGVYAPSIIKSQMTFSSNTMLTVMMGASASSAIILHVEDRLKLLPKKHSAPSQIGLFAFDGNIIGGSLLGVGMALTGACPGTALVQAGAGMINGMLVAGGGALGGMAFIKLQLSLKRVRAVSLESQTLIDPSTTSTPEKSQDIATALGLQPLVLLLIWIPMCMAVMAITFWKDNTVRYIPKSGIVPPAYGGLLIGAAQLTTTLLTHHTLGASAAYESLARWIDSKVCPSALDPQPKPVLLTPSVMFAGGVVCAAAVVSHSLLGSGAFLADSVTLTPKIAVQAISGGAIMVFGARTAKGCTSGHCISGLARFSLTSLVTTAAMFLAGVTTARITG